MPYVKVSLKARQQIDDLINDGADLTLMQNLSSQFELIAEYPARYTEPAKYPHSPRRLMSVFRLMDGLGDAWGFTVLLRRLPDEEGVEIQSINAGLLHFD